jgi:glycosyltransferase involved in cell wall biosynthesis
MPSLRPKPVHAHLSLFYWGIWALFIGIGMYFGAILLSIVRLILLQPGMFVRSIAKLLWASGFPTTVGIALILIDLGVYFPKGRKRAHDFALEIPVEPLITVALTAYNDELSIGAAVQDFLAHPRVKRVMVVSNNSRDHTIERAKEAGAITVNEERQGYGHCVCRCLTEAARWEDTDLVALCEGDMTFRAADLDKFLAYIPHAEIVNGTRIVEQLREYDTQLTTFMYYGNFFGGKLLEAKHFGKGTFTDLGTTYKVIRREAITGILQVVQPSVNLEFNAHFLDTALRYGFSIVECPVTFHPRVGVSKGGNVNNLRAMKVGLRMIWGLTFGWGLLA